jgi:hypothetical protein
MPTPVPSIVTLFLLAAKQIAAASNSREDRRGVAGLYFF